MRHITITLTAVVLALLASSLAQAQRIQLRLLNISDAPFGPAVVATHPGTMSPLLNPARPPSPELRLLARDGLEAPLASSVRMLADSHPYIHAGVIPAAQPGQVVVAEIPAAAHHRNLSLAAASADGGVVGIGGAHVPDLWGVRIDALLWDAGDTLHVHRGRPSPAARVWLSYLRPRKPLAGLPELSTAQAQERNACLAQSPTCVWRLDRGAGLCANCVPPLRPNAARTHCVD